ncbi:MAG: translation elongation factor Ts [Candidatus Ratteibacteria bacterium]|jgi:elongation factor Ts
MTTTVEKIKILRGETGLAIIDCKKALENAGGDLDKALTVLRAKSLEMAEKKLDKETGEGLIGSYVHTNGKIGVLVEVTCETDFVARTDDFKELVKNLTLQITASSPTWVSKDDVPEDVIEEHRKIIAESDEIKAKPEQVQERIVTGKMDLFFRKNVLLEQSYVKDDSKTVSEYIKEKIAKLGENIKVIRFVRFEFNKG